MHAMFVDSSKTLGCGWSTETSQCMTDL